MVNRRDARYCYQRLKTKTLLFLCTGNYYRSRFAEMWFNHLAAESRLGWKAVSRGLDTSMNHLLSGVISPATDAALRARNVRLPNEHRSPCECCLADLADADRVVALKEAEHRPLLGLRFPGWPDRVDYWHVHDVDQADAAVALAEIDRLVRQLVADLAAKSSAD
jgi:protein-tyrosine phosphatase